MKNKKTGIILILVFVLLLGGASLLYNCLSGQVDSNQLALQSQSNDDKTAENSDSGAEGSAENNDADDTEENNNTEGSAQGNNEESDQSDAEEENDSDKVASLDFTVYDANGNEVHLFDFRGKPVVLNFWASWCGPCQMEMPDFEEKYKEIGDEVQFLMINVTTGRETLESAVAFIEEKGYTFPVFYDTESDAADTYGASSLPTSYFIDAEGYIVAWAIGMVDADTLDEAISLIWNAE